MSDFLNVETKNLVTLTEAAALLPKVGGKKIHVSTIWRWCKNGLRGVALEYMRCGAKIVTSETAMLRFFAALAQHDERRPRSSGYKPTCLKNKPRAEAARQREIENATAILVRAKIIQTAPHKAAQS